MSIFHRRNRRPKSINTPVNGCVRRKSSSWSVQGAIAKSQIYRDFERAFTRGTGLPLSLHAPEMLNHETITILPAGYSKPEIFAWNKDTKFVRNRAFTTAEAL